MTATILGLTALIIGAGRAILTNSDKEQTL
jgi:hypothetical protein